ncbi:hypothetical protein F4778DRAFT_775866 [Xylariomycetidae sp. FL2044]|nr:hypothetical protein F4778DRAFT_775866 [Xylariomycetidae sp. FL2044]
MSKESERLVLSCVEAVERIKKSPTAKDSICASKVHPHLVCPLPLHASDGKQYGIECTLFEREDTEMDIDEDTERVIAGACEDNWKTLLESARTDGVTDARRPLCEHWNFSYRHIPLEILEKQPKSLRPRDPGYPGNRTLPDSREFDARRHVDPAGLDNAYTVDDWKKAWAKTPEYKPNSKPQDRNAFESVEEWERANKTP